ncbi:MAG: hypothetical protein AAFO75_01090, partial [Pseudomonadota bacterium]
MRTYRKMPKQHCYGVIGWFKARIPEFNLKQDHVLGYVCADRFAPHLTCKMGGGYSPDALRTPSARLT